MLGDEVRARCASLVAHLAGQGVRQAGLHAQRARGGREGARPRRALPGQGPRRARRARRGALQVANHLVSVKTRNVDHASREPCWLSGPNAAPPKAYAQLASLGPQLRRQLRGALPDASRSRPPPTRCAPAAS